jgi:hypothetical protein
VALDFDLLLSEAFARVIYTRTTARWIRALRRQLEHENEYKGKRGPEAVLDAINGPSLYDAMRASSRNSL